MTESKVCACGCKRIIYRNGLSGANWKSKKWYSVSCRNRMYSITRNVLSKSSHVVMYNYVPPSPEAAEVVNYFLYKNKPWTTEADRIE